MVIIIGYQDNVPEGYKLVNTTSRSTGLGKQLSPFFLGPVPTYNGMFAENVENAWQYSKVYDCHVHIDNSPCADWYAWRDEGWAKKRAERYPMGKGKKALYSWWSGQKYSYIEARKHVYIPLYSRAVIKTKTFYLLKEAVKTHDIALRDFDGYNHKALGMSYQDVINNEQKTMGHAFVLGMLLDGFLECS